MLDMSRKLSKADSHWQTQAETIKEEAKVNIIDSYQRKLENAQICKYIKPQMSILEAGCGNGYSTNIFRKRAKWVDAFDISPEMISRANATYGEVNNHFFLDDILHPSHINRVYDVVICIRVLQNLRNLKEQRLALKNLVGFVKKGGLLILVEGFKEGFDEISKLRTKVGLPPITPARINCYSFSWDLVSVLKGFTTENTFHLGMYDYLTRVYYPMVVGENNIIYNSVFNKQGMKLAQQCNPDYFEKYSRMKGFVWQRQ